MLIHRAGTHTFEIKNSSYVYLKNLYLDGDHTHKVGLNIVDSDHIYANNIVVDDYGQRGVVIHGSEYCTLANCDVVYCFDNASPTGNGAGARIKGESSHITFYTCDVSGNAADGIECNPLEDCRITDVDIYYCTVNDNGRQGFRCQEVDDPQSNFGSTNTAAFRLWTGDTSKLWRQDDSSPVHYVAGQPFGGLRNLDINNTTFTSMNTSVDYHIIYGAGEFEVYDGIGTSVDTDGDGIKDIVDVDQTGGMDANSDGIDDSPGCMMYRCDNITFDASQPSRRNSPYMRPLDTSLMWQKQFSSITRQ